MKRDLLSVPADPGHIMILLVDDQAMIAESVRRTIMNEPDMDLHYCADARDAVSVANSIKPMVILQDLVMPRMDGLMLIRLVQKLAPHIKTLAATGGESASRGGTVPLPGIKTVLRKPFTPAVLLQNLRALLDGEPPPATGSTFADS